MSAEIGRWVWAAVQSLAVAAVFPVLLLGGFALAFNLLKFWRRGSEAARGIDELVGQPINFLPAGKPRGPIDQLRASAELPTPSARPPE